MWPASERVLTRSNLSIVALKKNTSILSSFLILIILASTTHADETLCNYESQNGWIDCGGASWYLYNSQSPTDPPSLKSGPIENSGVSRICKVVKGPATITFRWKTDYNYPDLGQLSFIVNGERKYTCNSHEWKSETFELRYSGEYILSFEYLKYRSYPQNLGSGWITEFCITTKNLINSQGNIPGKSVSPLESDTEGAPVSNNGSNKEKRNLIYVRNYDDEINNTFSSINRAINKAKEGDTILVTKGIYEEKVQLNKSIKLIGEDKYGSIIRGNPSNKSVVYVTADDVIVQNLTIENGEAGICVNKNNGCQLINNNIVKCTRDALMLINSSSIVIRNNSISKCGENYIDAYIKLSFVNYFNISENDMEGPNNVIGVHINNSNHGIILMNKIKNLHCAISISNDSGNNTINEFNELLGNECDIFKDVNLAEDPTKGNNSISSKFKPC